MTTIYFKDTSFLILGHFQSSVRYRRLKDAIKEHGGTLLDRVSPKVQCVILGDYGVPVEQEIKAYCRGMVLLSSEEAKVLMRKKCVTIQEDDRQDKDFDLTKSIGELRSLFAQPPSSAVWTSMLEIVERCNDENLDALVDYMEPQLDLWEEEVKGPWDVAFDHALFEKFYPSYWGNHMPLLELRVAPPDWVIEVLQGRDSARHRLARGLNLEGMYLNSKWAMKVLNGPNWRRLRAIQFGVSNSFAKSFWAQALVHPALSDVKELGVYAYPDALAVSDLPQGHLSQVELLHCRVPKEYINKQKQIDHVSMYQKYKGQLPWLSEEVQFKRLGMSWMVQNPV